MAKTGMPYPSACLMMALLFVGPIRAVGDEVMLASTAAGAMNLSVVAIPKPALDKVTKLKGVLQGVIEKMTQADKVEIRDATTLFKDKKLKAVEEEANVTQKKVEAENDPIPYIKNMTRMALQAVQMSKFQALIERYIADVKEASPGAWEDRVDAMKKLNNATRELASLTSEKKRLEHQGAKEDEDDPAAARKKTYAFKTKVGYTIKEVDGKKELKWLTGHQSIVEKNPYNFDYEVTWGFANKDLHRVTTRIRVVEALILKQESNAELVKVDAFLDGVEKDMTTMVDEMTRLAAKDKGKEHKLPDVEPLITKLEAYPAKSPALKKSITKLKTTFTGDGIGTEDEAEAEAEDEADVMAEEDDKTDDEADAEAEGDDEAEDMAKREGALPDDDGKVAKAKADQAEEEKEVEEAKEAKEEKEKEVEEAKAAKEKGAKMIKDAEEAEKKALKEAEAAKAAEKKAAEEAEEAAEVVEREIEKDVEEAKEAEKKALKEAEAAKAADEKLEKEAKEAEAKEEKATEEAEEAEATKEKKLEEAKKAKDEKEKKEQVAAAVTKDKEEKEEHLDEVSDDVQEEKDEKEEEEKKEEEKKEGEKGFLGGLFNRGGDDKAAKEEKDEEKEKAAKEEKDEEKEEGAAKEKKGFLGGLFNRGGDDKAEEEKAKEEAEDEKKDQEDEKEDKKPAGEGDPEGPNLFANEAKKGDEKAKGRSAHLPIFKRMHQGVKRALRWR